jgi:CcmD family protein
MRAWRIVVVAAALAGLVAVAGPPAWAQGQPAAQPQRQGGVPVGSQAPPVRPEIPAERGQGEFVPVSSLPAQQEPLPAAPLVITAYVFVWVVLIVFLWSIWRRLGKVQEEIRQLQRRVGGAGR